MIIFDSSFLVVFLHPNPPPAKDREDKPVSQFRERVANLVSLMDISNDPIGVPAPAMAEVLVRAGKGRQQYVSILSNTYRFQILQKVKTNKQPWATWAKVSFDIQIVSIAKAEAASVIYADDKDIENLAKRLNIPVKRICDLPEPVVAPPEEIIIDSTANAGQQLLNLKPASDQTVASTEGTANGEATRKESNELEADTAHPTPVQGSDEGRAQGEAPGETETNQKKK